MAERLPQTSFLSSLVQALEDCLSPLYDSLRSAESLSRFLRDYGWTVDPAQLNLGSVQNGLPYADLQQLVGSLNALVSDSSSTADDYAKAIQSFVKILTDILGFVQNPPNLNFFPFTDPGFWTDFPEDLVQDLVIKYVRSTKPALFTVLRSLGFFASTTVTFTSTPGRASYVKRAINWTALSLLTKPGDLVSQTYGWSAAAFDFGNLLTLLQGVFDDLSIPTQLSYPDTVLLDYYYAQDNDARGDIYQLDVPIFGGPTTVGNLDIRLCLLPIPKDDKTGPPIGIAMVLILTGFPTGLDAGNWSLKLDGVPAGGIFVGLEFRLGEAVGIGSDLAFGKDAPLGLTLTYNPDNPAMVFGSQQSSALQFSNFTAQLDVVNPTANPEVKVGIGTDDAKLVIDLSGSDSFIGSMMGSSTQTIEFKNVRITWSSKSGLTFEGSGTLQASVPLHVNLGGVVEIDSITIGLGGGDSGLGLTIAATGGLTLGPVTASVDKIGIKLLAKSQLIDSSTSDPLKSFPVALGFKPPDGLGLAIDAGPVSGGGYIFFDEDKGEYAGIFSLGIDLPGESVDVNVIGLLDTKLPNGESGYSFLVIVCVTLPPIQLGFGFTLDGIGGVAGINRSMSLDSLRAGLKAHTLDSIFFPPDDPEALIKNAPKIISEVSAIFPVTQGAYVFGLLLELGWGTPTIVEAELGVIIELPDPVRLAILGVFKAGLPSLEVDDESELLVLIHIDILGTIDFEQKQLAIDGTIYDSRVVEFAISGDMALRYGWGASPNFAFSLGGFNPQFSPPAGFPSLQRFTVALGSGGDSLSLTSYLALTSNTAQTGADLELHASAAGFTVHGYLGFDALFIFSPFSFTVDVTAGLDLLQGSNVIAGINLDLLLSGPKPWHAHGSASLHILFFSVSANVDITIGSPAAAPPLPSVAVVPLLVAALADPKSWTTQLPDNAGASVVLAKAAAGDQTILVHPRGTLSVDQNVVPLAIHLDKFGNDTPSDADYLQIPHGGITINGQNPDFVADNPNMFALAQFQNFSDAQKLSLPAFQPEDAGVKFGSGNVQYGPAATLQMGYDTYYIEDMALPPRQALGVYTLDRGRLLAQAQLSGASWSSRQGIGSQKYVVPGTTSPIATQPGAYAVASTTDLMIQSQFATETSQMEAQQALNQHLAQHPEDTGKFQVVSVADAGVGA